MTTLSQRPQRPPRPTRRRPLQASQPTSLRTQLSGLVLVIVCFAAVAPIMPTMAFCPSKCRCDADNSLRIECPGAGLNVVPIQLNPDVKFINLTLNQIQNVHFTLQFYNGLEVLDLSDNAIVTLGSKNFESQTLLVALNLSRNLITHLSKDVFRGLRRLQTLRLSDNRIAVVHAQSMLDLVALRTMVLRNNSIVSLDDGTFRHLQALQTLDLAQNELLDVPIENIGHVVHRLQTLDLSQNYVEVLKYGSFEKLEELRWLDVSGNVLNDVDPYAFGELSRLEHLSLADNNITIMPTNQMSHLSRLTYLSLSGNRIVELPALAFANLFQLEELHLNRMDQLHRIDSRAFVDNTLLRSLSMDDNIAVSELPSNLFRNNPKLTEIRMRSNNLQTLDETHFPLAQLQHLYLANNPLVCNCSILWLWHLTQTNQPAGSGGSAPSNSGPSTLQSSPSQFAQRLPMNQSPRASMALAQLPTDRANVTCHAWIDNAAADDGTDAQRRRASSAVVLRSLGQSDLHCPAIVSYMVAAASVVGLLAVAAVGAYVAIRLRRRGDYSRERKHIIDDGMLPPTTTLSSTKQQHPDVKMRFDYRDQRLRDRHEHLQQLDHRTFDAVDVVAHHDDEDDDADAEDFDEELDHYEQFDDYRYDHRRHVMQPSLMHATTVGMPTRQPPPPPPLQPQHVRYQQQYQQQYEPQHQHQQQKQHHQQQEQEQQQELMQHNSPYRQQPTSIVYV